MKEIGKERKIAIAALIVAVLMLTVAFAAMSRTLKINGTAKVDSASWDIRFTSANMTSKKGDAREVVAPVIDNGGINLTLKVGLRKPKDEITYEAVIENLGDIDAEIESIEYPELNEEQAKIIEFVAIYQNGDEISEKQEINSGEEKTVKIVIRYKDITDESLLAKEAYDIPLTFKINYIQKGINTQGEPGDAGEEDLNGNENVKVSASGSYIYATDVALESHDIEVKLTSDTITDFSGVTVKRIGQNIMDVDAICNGSGSFAALQNNNDGTYTISKNDKVRFSQYFETFIPANTPMHISVNIIESSENIKKGMAIGFYNADKSKNESRIFDGRDGNSRLFSLDFDVSYIVLYLGYDDDDGVSVTFNELQVAIGAEEEVPYVPYSAQTITASADGTVEGLTSTSPVMFIYTNTSDVEIECEYQKKKK